MNMKTEGNELVVLKTYDNAIQAHMDKNQIEVEGIQSFLFDENTVSVNPLWNVTVGGIKLMVRQSEFARASGILQKLQQIPAQFEGEPIVCPHCKSTNISTHLHTIKGVKAALAFIVALFTLTYPVFSDEINKCGNCGKEF